MGSCMKTIGLDFGTTNSVVSELLDDGTCTPVRFATPDGTDDIFPTLLAFWKEIDGPGRSANRFVGGQWAVEAFRDFAPDCRLIKSLKTFAASRQFTSTSIFGSRYEYADLMRLFLTDLRARAGRELDWRDCHIIVGRPVRFAGSRPDEELALQRYDQALASFGFSSIRYVYEPVAAAYHFLRELDGEATIFVGDFGGGTSDYSLVRGKRTASGIEVEPLASQGLGIAGDQFDYRIIQHTVAEALGKGSKYRSLGKELEIPASYYHRLSSWNDASLLQGGQLLRELARFRAASLEPERIDRFMDFVRLGMVSSVIETVSEAKFKLSIEEEAAIRIDFPSGTYETSIAKADFEHWIAPDIARLDGLIDSTLHAANMVTDDVDIVFLSGGTSYVPAIRTMFANRFDAAKIVSKDQLTSVSQGLALIGRDSSLLA